MARPDYDVKESYIGTGSVSQYTFDFKIEDLSHLEVVLANSEGMEVTRVRGDDTEILDSVTFDNIRGGGTVTLKENLESGWTILLLLANDEPTQPYEFRGLNSFSLPLFERAMDFFTGALQRVSYLVGKSIKLNDLDSDNFETMIPPIPEDGKLKILELRADRSGLQWTSPAEIVEEGSEGDTIPLGGDEGDILAKASSGDRDVEWNPFGAEGFSTAFQEQVSLPNLRAIIDYLFKWGYSPPTISFTASGSTILREKGDPVTASTLSVNVQKNSHDISEVRFYQGSTLLDTQTEGGSIPNGGTNTYNWSGVFTDNTTFSVQVDDTSEEPKPSAQASRTFNFVYPYFWGSDSSDSLTAAQVAGLTKDIRNSSASVERTFSVSGGGYFYFAQPASYPEITQIFDANNFDVTASWTSFVGDYTALDGTTQSLRVYRTLNEQGADAYFRFVR